MTKKSPDLHGNAPDNASVALLLVDVINDLEFVGGDELLTHAYSQTPRHAQIEFLINWGGVGSWKDLYVDAWRAQQRGSGAVVVFQPSLFSSSSICCSVM